MQLRFSYVQSHTRAAGGAVVVQFIPLVALRIKGPGGWSEPMGCLVSSGSDMTVFPETEAADIGIDLANIQDETGLTDTGLAVTYRSAHSSVKITDGSGATCEFPTKVGFTTFPLDYPLLGHRGFLEFFDVQLLGELEAVVLEPNLAFPGLSQPGAP